MGCQKIHVLSRTVRSLLILMYQRSAREKISSCYVRKAGFRKLENMMCYLREFSKFVAQKEYSNFDMTALFSVKIRRESKIYPVISDKELELILKQVDTKTDMGKRDGNADARHNNWAQSDRYCQYEASGH